MIKRLLVVLFFLVLLGLGFFGFSLLRSRATAQSTALPTLADLPPSPTETDIPTATNTPTATLTFTPSATPTFTPTETFTPSMTLATRVLFVTAVNPALQQITPASTDTSTPLPTVAVPTPAFKVAALPTGTLVPPPVGWFEYDVQDPALHYQGNWQLFTGSYHSMKSHFIYSDADGAKVSLRFLGAAVRLRYVKYFTYGVLQVRLDGQVVATLDTYYPGTQAGDGNFVSTDVFGLNHGWHSLEVIRLSQKNPASKGEMIALDGIDVYENGSEPTLAPSSTPTFTPSPMPAQQIALINAPPTVQPTATQPALKVVAVSLIIAYDQNNNKMVDPNEGVNGVPVRLVTVGTNQVVATGFTNNDGYVHVQAMTDAPVRLVVPYFGKFWDVTGDQHITLLIPAGNQPGLIP